LAGRIACASGSRTVPSVKVDIQSTSKGQPVAAPRSQARQTRRRIVVVAHVQEPGANDNASGSATLYVMAASLAHAVRTRALVAPARTLTFIWGDEIRASRQWLSAHPEPAKSVQYMFSLDDRGGP
jgi:hypothetical protein